MTPWRENLFGLLLAIATVMMFSGGPQARMIDARVSLIDCGFCAVFAVLWIKGSEFFGLRQMLSDRAFRSMVRALGTSVLMTSVAVSYLLLRHAGSVRWIALFVFAVTAVWEGSWILIARSYYSLDEAKSKVLILGTGRRASKAWREIRTRPSGNRELVGFVDNRDVDQMAPDIAARFVTDSDHLMEFLLTNTVDELLVAIPMRTCYDLAQHCIAIAEAAGLRVVSLRDMYSLSHSHALRRRMDPYIELVAEDGFHHLLQAFKRSFDFTAALLLLIALSPLFLFIAVAVKLTSPGPVFFVQERYGHRRRRFRMYKFRSMVQNAPELLASLELRNEAIGPIFKIREDPRVTRLGRWLRRWSLDELPQLINVIRGEMSLVGPRPMSIRDVSRFSEATLMRRFSIRPGITGIWQVSGRSSLTFDEWIALDFHYIDHWSLQLDFKILARTLPAVVRGWGAA